MSAANHDDAAWVSVQLNELRTAVETAERRFLELLTKPIPSGVTAMENVVKVIGEEVSARLEGVGSLAERRRRLDDIIASELRRVPVVMETPAEEQKQEQSRAERKSPVSGPPVAASLSADHTPQAPKNGAADGQPFTAPRDSQGIPTIDTEPAAGPQRRTKAAALPACYKINTVVAMDEDDVQEFKDYNLDNVEGWALMQSAVRRTVNSFLNRSGGRLFFGITDEGLVKGIALHKKTRDNIRLEWDKIVNTMWPQVDIRDVDYTVKFIPVVNPQGEQLMTSSRVPVFVVVISVEQDPNLHEMGVYFTDKECRDAFTRASASCQRMSWQLVKDRIRRANELRKSKGIPPIDLSDSHYSRYEIWGASNKAPLPHNALATSSSNIPYRPTPTPRPVQPMSMPIPTVVNPFARAGTKRPAERLEPPRVPLSKPPAVSPTNPDNRRSSIQIRQIQQHIDRLRKQNQQSKQS